MTILQGQTPNLHPRGPVPGRKKGRTFNIQSFPLGGPVPPTGLRKVTGWVVDFTRRWALLNPQDFSESGVFRILNPGMTRTSIVRTVG